MNNTKNPPNTCTNGNVLEPQTKEHRRDDYIEWADYFMGVAFLAAKRSKDPHFQVGACIVNPEKKIVGVGYNGMPTGCRDDKEVWKKEVKHLYVCHAEMNAILNKNSSDVKGCAVYVKLFPCNECAKIIVQSGIREVIYMSDKKADKIQYRASRNILNDAGIKCTQYKPSKKKIVIDFDEDLSLEERLSECHVDTSTYT